MELYVNITSISLKYIRTCWCHSENFEKKGHMAQNFLFCFKSTVSDFIVERLRANSIENVRSLLKL